jgi:hypothetical protein
MPSKKSDQDLIAQVVRDLQAAGEEFTFDAAEVLLAARTTAKQPRIGPGDRLSTTDTRRALSVFGPKAVAALDAVPGALHLRGDERVYWVGRVEPGYPEDVEVPVFFDGHGWRDAPPAPERLGAILRGLSLDLDDERVRESLLQACDAVVGPVARTEADARAFAATPTAAAPAALLRRFKPPHVDRRAFVFWVDLPVDRETNAPAFLRLSLDMDTLKLDVDR